MPRRYHVYIMASRTRVSYIGVTGNLLQRVALHRSLEHDGFTRKYRCTRLVFAEETSDVFAALAREKQLKGWRRDKKIALIEASIPPGTTCPTQSAGSTRARSLAFGSGRHRAVAPQTKRPACAGRFGVD
jgi:putative endonuclease